MITAYNYIVGYKDENDADDESDVKTTEDIEEGEIPGPPPELVRQNGIHKGNTGAIDTKICWVNYENRFDEVDKEILKLKEELKKIEISREKNRVDEWKRRLSPVEEPRTLKTNKKRKKKKNNNNNNI